ncbi:hypothetical protein M885DRAFT_579171 [Pelagophyceae sp. CCMP2097]|nr:hypothetical protein M885DRAFT_579171 [Pelagophyceae sp. CCMP2097]
MSATLPNVLLVGDSISGDGTGYFPHVKTHLDGLAHVVRAGTVAEDADKLCGTSFGVAECASNWLLGGKWDVIHLNWGLHDVDAKLYAAVAVEGYVANLEDIIETLRRGLRPGGSLVWASTTPVPYSYHSRKDSDVVNINAAALQLLQSDCCRDVVVGADLYARVVERFPATAECTSLQKQGVHFSDVGRQFLGLLVSASIAPNLQTPERSWFRLGH